MNTDEKERFRKKKLIILGFELIATICCFFIGYFYTLERDGYWAFSISIFIGIFVYQFATMFGELWGDIVIFLLHIPIHIIIVSILGSKIFVFGGFISLMPSVVLILTQRYPLFILGNIIYMAAIPSFEGELIRSGLLLHQDRQARIEIMIGIGYCLFTKFITIHSFWVATKKSETEALKAKDLAESQTEKLKAFIQSFSHELRNPLNSLMGNIELALSEIANVQPKNPNCNQKQIHHYLKTAKTCCKLLLQLINNILDSGKADNGTLEVDAKASDLRKICIDINDIFGQIISSKGLDGTLMIAKNLPSMVNIDPIRIYQVIMNLVSNAVKFTKQGRIDVKIEWLPGIDELTDDLFEIEKPVEYIHTSQYDIPEDIGIIGEQVNRHISDKGSVFDEYEIFSKTSFQAISNHHGDNQDSHSGVIKIVVKDTGVGMNKDDLSHLFTKFAQFSRDRSSRQMGTGLGLNIAREIVRKSGGDIKAFSWLDVGTTFVTCIPSSFSTSFITDQPQSPREIQKSISELKLSFMVADDSLFNLNILKEFVQKMGSKLLGAHMDGQSLLEQYKRWHQTNTASRSSLPMIITDIDMPRMDGITMIKEIRAIESARNLPTSQIIIVSGNDLTQESKKVLKSDNHRHLYFQRKPLYFEDLMKGVYKLAHRRVEIPGITTSLQGNNHTFSQNVLQ